MSDVEDAQTQTRQENMTTDDDQKPQTQLRREDPPLFYAQNGFHQEAHPQVYKLWNYPQFAQRTPEWYSARHQAISASDVAKALFKTTEAMSHFNDSFGVTKFTPKPDVSCDKYGCLNDLLFKKTDGPSWRDDDRTAMKWGQQHEPVVQSIYSQMHQVDLLEFGSMRHPDIPFLLASPDGITVKGRMLEIKCPLSRQVHPTPLLHYHMQMYMQLECCDLEVCDFMDNCFRHYYVDPRKPVEESDWYRHSQQWWRDHPDSKHHVYGIMLRRSVTLEKDESEDKRYIYAPLDVVTTEDFIKWAKTTAQKQMLEYEESTERVYYHLCDYHITEVIRQPEWLRLNLPQLEKVWNQILALRGDKDAKKDFHERYLVEDMLFGPRSIKEGAAAAKLQDLGYGTSLERVNQIANDIRTRKQQRKTKTTKDDKQLTLEQVGFTVTKSTVYVNTDMTSLLPSSRKKKVQREAQEDCLC